MGDDLSQFFAKKKSKDKKKARHNVEDVGHVLEREAKRQEERDRENEEEDKRVHDDSNFLDKRSEDSEWLEYKDTNREIILEELGLRDMNLNEQVEEALEEEKTTPAEAPKTWNMAAEPVEEQLPVPVSVQQPQQQKATPWRPKRMQAPIKTGAAPNINDQEMFPSFEDAEKIEKQNKEHDKKKKNDGFTEVTSDREASRMRSQQQQQASSNRAWQTNVGGTSSDDRVKLLSTVKQVTSSGAPNPVPPATQTAAPKTNVYVPPSRRNK